MIVIMKKGSTPEMVGNALEVIKSQGLKGKEVPGEGQSTICVLGNIIDKNTLEGQIINLSGVRKVNYVSTPYKVASIDFERKSEVVVSRGDVSITLNGSESIVMAGPCTIESEEQIFASARYLSSAGIKVMRGGAFKPRTSPYSFQGMGEEGLKLAREAADKYGMLFITEATDVREVKTVAKYADIIQIGTRNMQNFALLLEVGKTNLPVLLKRGMSATIEEFLCSAEYILSEQETPRVILCLRGIRTFEKEVRGALDLHMIPVLRRLTWLPIVVDPSHAAGIKKYVPEYAMMAAAANISGLLIEVHPDPAKALIDGGQSLNHEQFSELYPKLQVISQTAQGKKLT